MEADSADLQNVDAVGHLILFQQPPKRLGL